MLLGPSGTRRSLASEGVGVKVGRGVKGAFVVSLRFGVEGMSGTLNPGSSGAFDAFFGFVDDAFSEGVGVAFGFLMLLVLISVGSAARFLVIVFAMVDSLASALGSEILEERRRDILRTSF
jgi:hypothetical protein